MIVDIQRCEHVKMMKEGRGGLRTVGVDGRTWPFKCSTRVFSSI